MRRRAARVDENQAEIVKALRRIGCTVQSLASVGEGCPDLLVSLRGKNHLLEVKNPDKPTLDQQLTPAQFIWIQEWAAPVHVVKTVAEAIYAVTWGKP